MPRPRQRVSPGGASVAPWEDPRAPAPGGAHLLLCWPVRCRNAFRVALRSSLIFSCGGNAGVRQQGPPRCREPPPPAREPGVSRNQEDSRKCQTQLLRLQPAEARG